MLRQHRKKIKWQLRQQIFRQIVQNQRSTHMEFISLGGLVPGLSADDIKSGISQPRNRNIAEICHRINYIESYGTGILRIFSLFENCSEKPEIEVSSGMFRIILPNISREKESEVKSPRFVKKQWEIVIDYLNEYGEMT